MTFEEKKRLLHWLFDGFDKDGKSYNIYVDKEGEGKDSFIEFSLHARLTKAFDSDTEDDDIRSIGGTTGGSQSGSPNKSRSSDEEPKDYKTTSRSFNL